MSTNRVLEICAIPFVHHLCDLINADKDVQAALHSYSFPPMNVCNTQYFCCEVRQWDDHGERREHQATTVLDYMYFVKGLEKLNAYRKFRHLTIDVNEI